jgi:hypothetical protein
MGKNSERRIFVLSIICIVADCDGACFAVWQSHVSHNEQITTTDSTPEFLVLLIVTTLFAVPILFKPALDARKRRILVG